MNDLYPSSRLPLQDGDLLAAVDVGSNSFHMVVARYLLGQLRIVDRLRETVRLAEGLDGRGGLDPSVRQRAIECLARFGQRVADIPPQHIRAIATNAVRNMGQPQTFLLPAEGALGHAIEVVSGREEARLVYLGVAHSQPARPGELRLVIDIGGGSTECIIGAGFEAIERESLQLGCIASTRRFFPTGKLSKKKWRDALTEATAEFQQFANTYRALGWHEVVGSSGTNRAIGEVCAAMKLTKGSVTAEALVQVRDRLLQADRIEDIDLPGLSSDRRPVFAGGVLVLEAAFSALNLQRMQVSKAAMREGILYDMLGRGGEHDPRDASVESLMVRYAIDQKQAARVEATLMRLFDQVAEAWSMDEDDRLMLARAARLHELGQVIAHSQYHVHGSYVVENSDIAGFSQQQQRFLAALVRTHRRSIPKSAFDALPDRVLPAARRGAALLRLAVLLHRSHENGEIPRLDLRAEGNRLTLTVSRRWMEARPLVKADLYGEPEDAGALGIQLAIVAA